MKLARWLPPALWAGVIATLTSWPSPPRLNVPEGSDKLVHAALYGVLAALVSRAVRGGTRARARWSTAVALVFAIGVLAALDEWHQQYIVDRSADVRDWMADVTGAVVGVAAFTFVARARASRQETPT